MRRRPEQPAIDIGPRRQLARVNVLRGRLVRQILHDRMRLPQREGAIDQGRNPSIRVEAQIVARLVLAAREVDGDQFQTGRDMVGCEQHAT